MKIFSIVPHCEISTNAAISCPAFFPVKIWQERNRIVSLKIEWKSLKKERKKETQSPVIRR